MSAMSLQTALTELVAFARENGGEERPRIQAACKRAEKRIDRLQMSRENRAAGRVCRRCGLGCFGLCCWKCWQAIPQPMRNAFDGAKTTGARREATRAVLDFIQRNPIWPPQNCPHPQCENGWLTGAESEDGGPCPICAKAPGARLPEVR